METFTVFDEIVVFFCINNPNIISSFDVLMLVCSTPLCTFLFSKKIYVNIIL